MRHSSPSVALLALAALAAMPAAAQSRKLEPGETEAIRFERAKDAADAREARKHMRSTRSASRAAQSSADRSMEPGEESKVKMSPTGRRLEPGELEAIRYQRAKDRADAAQARKEARNPEHFTYATPQNNPPDSLANAQREEALEKKSGTTGSADRAAPNPKREKR